MRAVSSAFGLVAVIATACGSEPPRAEPPPPPPPALTKSEAARLPGCIEALEKARDNRAAPALIAVGCAPQCDLDVPASIAADADQLLAFVAGRCARDADAGQKMWRLAELGGAWIADIYDRAKSSHRSQADRLDELFDEVQAPLHLEARVGDLYRLPAAAQTVRRATELYVVVGPRSVSAGITGWAAINEAGAIRKVGFGGPFPGRRVKLRELRALVTQLHATISDDENATAVDRAPLLLADAKLPVARLRKVVRRLGRARLGVTLRGLAGEHKTHLNWIDRWSGTWLLFRPGRAVIRTADNKITLKHRGGAIDWAGVRAALASIGGGDLALDPPETMTVRELTVVLDQITTSDSDPALFFARRPGLVPAVTVDAIEISEGGPKQAAVREALDGLEAALLDCYKPLAGEEGSAVVALEIDRRGRARETSVETAMGSGVPECLKAAVGGAKLPRPRARAAKLTIRLGFAAN